MALISMYQRDNSQTVYRILADEAVKCLENPAVGPEEKVLLINLARLLERYRYNAFSDHAPLGVLEALKAKNEALGSNSRRGPHRVERVITALEAAHVRVYEKLSRDELVQELQTLLAEIASASPVDRPDIQDKIKKARRFFLAFSEGLK